MRLIDMYIFYFATLITFAYMVTKAVSALGGGI